MSAGHTKPLIELAGLKRSFEAPSSLFSRLLGRKPPQVKAVDGVDLRIAGGETLGLVGESGCGKSTIARLAVGLLRPSEGRVLIEGNDLATIRGSAMTRTRQRIQMIFQDPYSSMNGRWQVGRIIAEPIRRLGVLGTRREINLRVGELLEQVGLTAADARKYPHEFSGGQRQRIAIARAISTKPEFLVCDEPTSALDVSVQSQILNLMKDLQSEMGLTFLFISHNLAVISHVSNRVGVMYLGRIVEIGAADEIFSAPRHPYTRLLLETVPDLKKIGQTRAPLSGEVPSPINPPSGCAFHPRCPIAVAECRASRPELRRITGGIEAACHRA